MVGKSFHFFYFSPGREKTLGAVANLALGHSNASGGGIPRWENGQPCRAGLFRLMLDPATNNSYKNWESNFETWMTRHLARLESDIDTQASGPWNVTAIPKNWSGIAYWDVEEVKPSWQLNYQVRGQGDCRPLGGPCDGTIFCPRNPPGPCTAMWGDPPAESNTCPGCSGPSLWYWYEFVEAVTRVQRPDGSFFPKIPNALVVASGLDPETASQCAPPRNAGTSGVFGSYGCLDPDAQLTLLSNSYNHYAQRFFGGTLKKLKELRPRAQWGLWSYPKRAYPSFDQFVDYRPFIPGCSSGGDERSPDFPCTNRSMFERVNDDLAWLFDEVDVLLPALYADGWVSDTNDAPCGPCSICAPNGTDQLIPGFDLYTKARADTYIKDAVAESMRIKAAQAATGHDVKVLPFFWWHMGGNCSGINTFIQDENLKRHFKLTKEGGADGMVVWGAAGPMTSASAGSPGEVGRPELVTYWHEHWSPLVEEYCDP